MNACLAAHFRNSHAWMPNDAPRSEQSGISQARRHCLKAHRARAVRHLQARFGAHEFGMVAHGGDSPTTPSWFERGFASVKELWARVTADFAAPWRRSRAVGALRTIDARVLADIGLSRG